MVKDFLGVILTFSEDGLETSEDEDGDRLLVRLEVEPESDVVIYVKSKNQDEGVLDEGSRELTFTGDNWNRNQPVTIIGVEDDGTQDGDQEYEVYLSRITSDDSRFDKLQEEKDFSVTVTNIDNDVLEGNLNPIVISVENCFYHFLVKYVPYFLSFLPLSHVLERMAGHFFAFYISSKIYYAENMETVGELINVECDNLLYEARGNSIPRLREMKETMMEAGAYGCSISGSGPAIFAIVSGQDGAKSLRDKIVERFSDRELKWLISPLNSYGSKVLRNIDDWYQANRGYHNFW